MTLVQLLAISAGIAAVVIVLLSNEKGTPRPPDAKPDIRLQTWDGQGRKIKRR